MPIHPYYLQWANCPSRYTTHNTGRDKLLYLGASWASYFSLRDRGATRKWWGNGDPQQGNLWVYPVLGQLGPCLFPPMHSASNAHLYTTHSEHKTWSFILLTIWQMIIPLYYSQCAICPSLYTSHGAPYARPSILLTVR